MAQVADRSERPYLRREWCISDIDEASKRVQMDKLVLSQLPSTVETAAA